MAHLRKSSTTGHLLKMSAGHLTKSCGTNTAGCTIECAVPDVVASGGDDTGCPAGDQIPDALEFTIVSAAACGCDFDTHAGGHVWVPDASGLEGMTFTLNYGVFGAPGPWYGTFDVTGLFKIKKCSGDGSGCSSCTPAGDILSSATLEIWVTAFGDAQCRLTVESSDPDFEPFPVVLASGVVSTTNTWTDCCTPWSLSGDGCLPMQEGTPIGLEITDATIAPC